MKKINLLLLCALLFSSCAPASTQSPTISETAEISTETSTPIPTDTPIPTSTSTPTVTLTPLPITFVYQDDVPAEGRAIQESAVDKAYTYYSKYADLGPITVYTFEDIKLYIDQIFPAIQADVPTYTKSKFVQDWIAGGGGNTSAKDIVVISSGSLPWKDDFNKCYKAKNVAHELFHILQSRLMHHGLFRPALDYGPEWLKEGSAEVFGNKIADGINGCSYSSQLTSWLNESSSANYPLREVESGDFSSKIQFWSLAPYAVDSLIKLAPKGDQSVIDFYLEIGKGTSWSESFKSAFGMSIEEFYTRFDSTRAKDEIDTSVCVAQMDPRVKCLGRKPNKDFIFQIPINPTTQANEWKTESACSITGLGLEGSDVLHILQISVTDDTVGICQVKVTFSVNQQVTVSFIVPVDTSVIDQTVCKDSTSSGDFSIQCIGRLPGIRIVLASPSAGGNQHIVQYVFDVSGFDLTSKSLGELGISSTCELISWEVSGSTILTLDVNSKSISKDCTVTVSPSGSGKSAQITFLVLGFTSIPTSTPTNTPTVP